MNVEREKMGLNSLIRLVSRQVPNGMDDNAVEPAFGKSEIGARFPAQQREVEWGTVSSDGRRNLTLDRFSSEVNAIGIQEVPRGNKKLKTKNSGGMLAIRSKLMVSTGQNGLTSSI